ncbi:uncharacterized protein LOC120081005 [Benincasa hispida]|uniref:uncharacterized protein LOC120081005 n=1 Tax=Benincasa hispida TaxID=102211 RepID=UPI001901EE46|nr:uncharacterized protein LOC120081005 [Benincasa hispida]
MAQVDEKAMESRIEEAVAFSLMDRLQDLIRNAMGGQTAHDQTRQEQDFKKFDPRPFDGSLRDPMKAKMWLSSIEKIFHYMRCPEEHKLRCAVFMLIDNVEIWWCSIEKRIDTSGELATWDQFKERFYKKYFSANTQYNK